LGIDLTPNFSPNVKHGDPEWNERYAEFNNPNDYHNGGIWPFISGIYIAALVAAKKYTLAQEKLNVLTHFIKKSRTKNVVFGFNEWIKEQEGNAMGQDWQTWSAALYLYAAKCVEEKKLRFLMKYEALHLILNC